jgi:predicted porin
MRNFRITMQQARLAASIAAVGFCGLAQAQSNVTVYGNLDVAINKESGSTTKLGRGYNNWLGFKGQEDLGDGLATTFNLQTRFLPNTGALERASTFLQGESTVGLKSASAGSVRFGRALTPLWNSIWAYEPWYNSGFNGSLASYQTGSYTSDGVTDAALGYANFSRLSNGIFYDSPSMSGFRVAAAGQLQKTDPAASSRNIGATLNYSNGPVNAMLSYEHNQNSDHIYAIAASYGFGDLTLMGSYARTSLTGGVSERVAVLAATYAVGSDTIRAGYGRNSEGNSHKTSVGYVHPLSKRTNLYADLYQEKTTENTTGYAVGMNHTF